VSLTDRQRQIVDAALTLIARKGIQGLTMKKLASAVGISEPAIYRHFGSKMQILLAIVDSFDAETRELFRRAGESGTTALGRIESVLIAQCERLARNPTMSSAAFSEDLFRNEARLLSRVVRMMQDNAGRFQAIVQDGVRSGEVRDDVAVDQLVQIIMGALRLLVTRWRLGAFAFDLLAEGRRLWGALRQILVAEGLPDDHLRHPQRLVHRGRGAVL